MSVSRGAARTASVLLFSAVLAIAATARAEESRWNLHLQLGPLFILDQPATVISSDQLSTGAFDLRFAVEWELHERIGLELAYQADLLFNQAAQLQAQQDFLLGVRFRPWWSKDGGYLLPRNPRRPIVFLNDVLSDAWIDAHLGISSATRSRLIYDVGIGTRVAMIWPLQLGLFVRYQQLIALGGADETSFKQLVVGLQLSAGFLPVHPEPDSDGDGVPDSRDRCPDTGPGVRVNEFGCPYGQGLKGGPTCSDEDLDGVCDGSDDCPDTPYGTKVDAHGCPPKQDEPEPSAPPPSE